MKCMCAQTRPRFIISSEGVLGGMEFEPMLTPREKSPLPENVTRGGWNPRRCGQRAQALPTELFRPPLCVLMLAPSTAVFMLHRSGHHSGDGKWFPPSPPPPPPLSVSVYCDWVSLICNSISVWQHVKLSVQIRP